MPLTLMWEPRVSRSKLADSLGCWFVVCSWVDVLVFGFVFLFVLGLFFGLGCFWLLMFFCMKFGLGTVGKDFNGALAEPAGQCFLDSGRFAESDTKNDFMLKDMNLSQSHPSLFAFNI